MKLVDVDCKVNIDENEPFMAKSKAIALVCRIILPKLKLIDVDCRLNSDETEPCWPKSKAIALVFCIKLTKIEID